MAHAGRDAIAEFCMTCSNTLFRMNLHAKALVEANNRRSKEQISDNVHPMIAAVTGGDATDLPAGGWAAGQSLK